MIEYLISQIREGHASTFKRLFLKTLGSDCWSKKYRADFQACLKEAFQKDLDLSCLKRMKPSYIIIVLERELRAQCFLWKKKGIGHYKVLSALLWTALNGSNKK